MTAGSGVISGVIPVLETPFQPDGEVDQDSFRRLLRHVARSGVDAVMFPGYASESLKLSDAERQWMLGELLNTPGGPAVVVSITDHSSHLAVRRARDAAAGGAVAVNILPPYLLKPSIEDVRDHIGAVLRAVDPLPGVVQFAPHQTGTALAPSDLAALAVEHSNLYGVKIESTPPGPMIAALTTAAPRLAMLVGYAGLYLPEALSAGASGVWPGSSFVELYTELWRRQEAGQADDFAALHARLRPFLHEWMRDVEVIVAVEKAISVRRGLIAHDVCRAPAFRLDGPTRRSIDSFLDEFVVELGDRRP